MGFDRLKFSKNWNSATDFPAVETSETQVRADMQLLHDESKSALNALMEALEKGGRDALVRFGSDEVKYIRLNQYGGLEVSSDGVHYSVVTTGTEGGAAPSIHAGQHKAGGSDPITPADIGAQPTVTGAATTITGSNLAVNRALVSNGSGKVSVSAVTATELGCLDGVTSSIQTQLDGKAPSGHSHTLSDLGAVNKTGDTMTGDLRVERSSYPSVRLISTGNGSGAVFQQGANQTTISNQNVAGDSNNYRLLSLNNSSVFGMDSALRLTDVVNGQPTAYDVLHKGNAAALLDELGIAPWVETGSYTGTGAGNVKITFSKVPEFISVYGTGQLTNGTETVYGFVDAGTGAGVGWRRWADKDGSVSNVVTTISASVSGNTVTLSGGNLNSAYTHSWVAHG